MRIHDDHLYHGAALVQIAEHPEFTAINALKIRGRTIRVAYKINDDIAVYLKYATAARAGNEYGFTFTREHINQLGAIAQANSRCVIALVCVGAKEICVLEHDELLELLNRRESALGGPQDVLQILVSAPTGKSFRVAVSAPGRRRTPLGGPLIVSRNAFPNRIFHNGARATR